MKLNLIPTSAARQGASKITWVIMVLMIVGSIFGAMRMNGKAAAALNTAKGYVDSNQSASNNVNTVTADADTVMSEASGPLLNIKLVQAMKAHCRVYTDFYDQVFRFIPGYFRLTSISVSPNDANTCSVQMTGTVGSLREYMDLVLALRRIPGSQQVTRSGYQLTHTFVQPISANTQHSWKIKPGEAELTDDPIQRLDAKIAAAHSTDFVGVGNFGTPGLPRTRGADPSETLLTVGVVITRNLMTPDPRQTLAGEGAAFATSPGAPVVAPPAAAPTKGGRGRGR